MKAFLAVILAVPVSAGLLLGGQASPDVVSDDEAANIRGGACFDVYSVTACTNDQAGCPVVNGFWFTSGGTEDISTNIWCDSDDTKCGSYAKSKHNCSS